MKTESYRCLQAPTDTTVYRAVEGASGRLSVGTTSPSFVVIQLHVDINVSKHTRVLVNVRECDENECECKRIYVQE